MTRWLRSGAPWVWLTAGAVSLSLIVVLGLLLLIGWKGLGYFWPAPVYQFEVQQNGHQSIVIGEVYGRKAVPVEQLTEAGIDTSGFDGEKVLRYVIKTGNRDVLGSDFVTVLEPHIVSQVPAAGVAVIERLKNGRFYGIPVGLTDDGVAIPLEELEHSLDQADSVRDLIRQIEKKDLVALNHQFEQLNAQLRNSGDSLELMEERQRLEQRFAQIEQQLLLLHQQLGRDSLIVKEMTGQEITLPIEQILDIWYPNDFTAAGKFGHWLRQLGHFVSDDPREANTEGGVFPAIFGTVFMVLLMSVIVTPLGVLAAVYLHEYAGKSVFTKLLRVAVINLAGVPSIVYGVFGLGFFVYIVGAQIDDLFFAEQLPAPTFGTPGILWSALTLAILTLPVVIVSTEEGLARIPNSIRHGSLALGATQAETLWRTVLPMASPAIMTGLILAVARAAGEVAPLMLVGVVKMAPSLPIDGQFPYLHLDRKFMHLGYHIYDVGFQSPNVEAARPLVYATSFLLVTVIVGLNLTAIGIRNHLREKFRSLEQ
ncbi:phosphate ABC transporter permease PtsA [Photobacterium gaetbulicola]|uniref:Phosphate transport system permease protein PstA n=1 Tax=Photobacterium gaetbulicola Gung47 TaxID=658445 RepID=A0A0C5WDG8_9GAMM|nr:phosphate ABC transporter permease PstA [Photobacterium gaetbulicola]AJR09746.1 putative phosphate ABC transporter, permease protein [Photobacterium gaetbulicola Gung47]PSU06363.1 phosphate ABC transporter permease PtsA [Photobacterium gaetbulicola]